MNRETPFPEPHEETTEPEISLSVTRASASFRPSRRPGIAQIVLVLVLLSVLGLGSALFVLLLWPSAPLLLINATASPPAPVGRLVFTSSGQVDPLSTRGLNDIATIDLHGMPASPAGKSQYAWLLPDPGQDGIAPLLLGVLTPTAGPVHLTYTSPSHSDLLTTYSGLRVTEEAAGVLPTTPSLDPSTWRDTGSFPTTPTPGDPRQFSFLSHLRHLLAQDPTLTVLNLSGGLEIWLYRNSGKVLEESTAARDEWAGGKGSAGLLRRQIVRMLDDLDGAAFVWRDVPVGTPFLVDPAAGRLGLLDLIPAQNPPGYLAHVRLHLQGLVKAPGATVEQLQLAERLDAALATVTTLMQHIRTDALQLVKLTDNQLVQPAVLTLLNDIVTNATNAFAGQAEPTTGGTLSGGIVWVHEQMQTLASMPVSLVAQ